MQEAIAQTEFAMLHLERAQERLDLVQQGALVTLARTLIATARAVTGNARRSLQQAEEETCKKS